MIPASEIRFWLNTLDQDAKVGVDPVGLKLVDIANRHITLDVGEVPSQIPGIEEMPYARYTMGTTVPIGTVGAGPGRRRPRREGETGEWCAFCNTYH